MGQKHADTKYWDGLAARYLARYNLPGWDVQYTAEAAVTWLDRLDLPVAEWRATGNYRGLEEFGEINPGWPLRAAIGLMLELRHEREGGGT